MMKRRSVYKTHFKSDIQDVWDAMTGTSPQSDLVKPLSQEEYDSEEKDGAATYFVVTESSPCSRYAFSLKNEFMTATYSAELSTAPKGGTDVTFIDEVEPKSTAMYLMSLLSFRLKSGQRTRASGLKARLDGKGAK